ncbi:MAG: hypothetical protein QW275_02010 [Candidatus Anstonellaceae archaeon]
MPFFLNVSAKVAHFAKAQASTELLAVLGIALLVIIFFAAFASDVFGDSQQQSDIRQARIAVQRLAEAADYVYAQGEGASMSVRVDLPPSADYAPNKTYIGKPIYASDNSSSNAITIHLYGGDVSAYTKAPIVGAFPQQPGSYSLQVTSLGGIVKIGNSLVDPKSTAIYAKVKRGEIRTAFASFSTNSSYPVILNASYSWNYDSPSISMPSSIIIVHNGTAQIPITFISQPSNMGIYTGTLIVTAYPAGSSVLQKESYKLPITLEVYG